MSRIYIETTIPSFYHEVRADPKMVARREWTREWFDVAIANDELVTSAAVLDELERGDFPGRDEAGSPDGFASGLRSSTRQVTWEGGLLSLRDPGDAELKIGSKHGKIWW